MVMEKRKTNERGSNHMKSQLERFMRRKGRQFCAAALCVLMLVSNVATSIGSTGEDSNEVAEFTVDRDSLCVELVKAVERGKTVKNTLEFDGEEADTYAELFDADGTLYKLKPEIKDNASKLSLTVYARLGEELEKEDRQNYEIDGSEEIIFLLKNEADREQTAVIRVGDKCSEEITVAAGSAVGVTEEKTVEETVAGPADENAAPGGGSAADGAAAEETVSDGTLPAEESTAASDIEESKEETSAPAEGAGEQETDAPEQESGSEIEAPKEDGENATETGEGQEEVADQDEEKTENESGVTEDNGTGAESGTAEGGDTSEKADDGQTAGDDNKSEQGADHSGASESGSSDNAENSDSSSSDSSDSGDDGSDGSVTASISVHNVARVMTTVEAANGATPQEAEKEETVVEVLNEEEDEATEEEDEATPSEATPSELWESFTGESFDAVRLGDGAAVAFVTTAEELGLDDEIYEAELDNVIVRVTADRGILPEGADLSVTELSEENEETAEQYKEAKKALDEDGTEYDGMMALDISFFDAEGNELEPEDGTVRVFIEMKPEALPEDVALETLAVQHLKETEDGKIKVEKVADPSDETAGIVKKKEVVENEQKSTVAEFEIESFSTFVVTYGETTQTINLSFIDESGRIISPADGSVILNFKKTGITTPVEIKDIVAGGDSEVKIFNDDSEEFATIIGDNFSVIKVEDAYYEYVSAEFNNQPVNSILLRDGKLYFENGSAKYLCEDNSNLQLKYVESEYNLSLTKQWKTDKGETVLDENIPFDEVRVEVEQYYMEGVDDEARPVIIDSDILVMTKENGWMDYYRHPISQYTLFRTKGQEKVYIYDENGQAIEKNASEYDWKLGNVDYTKDYGTASVTFGDKLAPSVLAREIYNNQCILIKPTGGETGILWIPFLDKLGSEVREDIRNVINDNVPTGVKTPIRFYDETIYKKPEVKYSQEKTSIRFEVPSDWSLLFIGTFLFGDTTFSASLTNTLDTTKMQDVMVKKVWDDNNDTNRPQSVDIAVKNGSDTEKQVSLGLSDSDTIKSADKNTWTKMVSVPKYNSNGSKITYTIEETVPTNYSATYDQQNLTVTNRPNEKKLSITKIVDGNIGNRNHTPFKFYLTLSKGTEPDKVIYQEELKAVSKIGSSDESDKTISVGSDGRYVFYLSHDETISITVPYGYEYTVNEDDYSGEGYTVNYTGDGTLKNGFFVGSTETDKSILVKNTNTVNPPTGIFTTDLPHLLMLAFAFFSTAALALFSYKRKVRRAE